jgi:hypothetical protein
MFKAAHELDPADGRTAEALREAERAIKDALGKDGVSGEKVPELAMPLQALTTRPFTPHEGFVLSRINGQWDVKSIMKISPMKELDVLMIFQKLSKDGVDPLEESGVPMREAPALRSGRALRALQVAVCAAAGALLAALLPGIPWERWPELLFFAGLTTLAFRLRVRYAGNYVGVESAALIPAILLLNSPGAGMLVCIVADAISKLLARPRRLRLSNSFDIAQLAISYAAAALFCQALHSAGAGWITTAALSTGALLVFFFINTALVFAFLEMSRAVPREKLLEIALFQLAALLLLTPIVILEILVYGPYGPAGMLLAFFPVVLASFVMRSLSTMEKRVAEISRRNKELDAMRDISTSFGVSSRSTGTSASSRPSAGFSRWMPWRSSSGRSATPTSWRTSPRAPRRAAGTSRPGRGAPASTSGGATETSRNC